jgi:hypothetical protein
MSAVANLLGESLQQLQQSLKGGQSLGQVLQANGFTAEQGAQAFLSGLLSGLSNDVAAGTITQQQANTALANQTNRINSLLQTSVSNPGLTTGTSTTSSISGTGSILNASA